MARGTYNVSNIKTKPFPGQNPGTSGLRKKCQEFLQEHYAENFIQSIISTATANHKNNNFVLVLGGDGRYMCEEISKKVIAIAAANNISKVIVGKNGILSTPALSHIVRKYSADGGIILSASHNPGGPEGDFGIKYNIKNGGPATEIVTAAIYNYSTSIKEYHICRELERIINLSELNSFTNNIKEPSGFEHEFELVVIDQVKDYVEYMGQLFDFQEIGKYVKENNVRITVDSLSGVTGPYAIAIMKAIGVFNPNNLVNVEPLPDFGGLHPDPNLVHGHCLVEKVINEKYDIGAAFDGDGDRNMIIGDNGYFIGPSDSLAIICYYAVKCIPYFKKLGQLSGVARSLPTSGAVDKVATKLGVPCYIVPTGWKFFGNLMDAGKLSICGEESFGTGSDHIREKDGIWAFLAWLSIMAFTKKPISQIALDHFKIFGRNYYMRHDYENLENEIGEAVVARFENYTKGDVVGTCYENGTLKIKKVENFSYKDPIDNSYTSNQGLVILFEDDSKIILRKSGTGSSGITLRFYFERFIESNTKLEESTTEMIEPLVKIANEISNIAIITGKSVPDVAT